MSSHVRYNNSNNKIIPKSKFTNSNNQIDSVKKNSKLNKSFTKPLPFGIDSIYLRNTLRNGIAISKFFEGTLLSKNLSPNSPSIKSIKQRTNTKYSLIRFCNHCSFLLSRGFSRIHCPCSQRNKKIGSYMKKSSLQNC